MKESDADTTTSGCDISCVNDNDIRGQRHREKNNNKNDMSSCANCGKGEEGSNKLKACTACKMVKYCNRECQLAHRPQHKKECKKQVAKLHEEALFKQPPRNEDCVICFLPLPLHVNQKVYMACCGKELCLACVETFDELDEDGRAPCPFCRTPAPDTESQEMKRITTRMKQKNDCHAYNFMGTAYLYAKCGCEADSVRASELFLKAGKLGSSDGYCNLGNLYTGHEGEDGTSGVEPDNKKAQYYYELAAIKGHSHARYFVGEMEIENGNVKRGYQHYLIAAKSGYDVALNLLKKGYKEGHVTKDEYAEAIRSHRISVDLMKSPEREEAAAFGSGGFPNPDWD